MRIIIVEDNPDHQLIFRKKLESYYESITVDTAVDVAGAQRLLLHNSYNVILLDYRLKGESGIELVNWVHEHSIDTPVIMITSLEDVEIAVKAIKLGVYDYICKNAESFEKLPFLIKKVMQEHALKKKLNEAEFKYRTLVEGMNEAVFLIKPNADFIYVSSSVEKLFGYTEEEFKENFVQQLSGADRKTFLTNIARVSEGKNQEPFVISVRDSRGKSRIIEINASPFIPEKEQKGVIGTIQDVTEHVLLEREIESERQKINDIFNTMIDWIYVVDEDYNIKFINKILANQIGDSRKKKCYTLLYNRKKPCPYCKWSINKMNKTVRWELRREDGKTFDIISSPLKNPDGSLYSMNILRDVTKKKEVEENYRLMSEKTMKANQELMRTIEKLKQTQEQLVQSEKLAAIGKLVSGVAHELNNPLFSAMGYTELLAMDSEYGGEDREKLENILDSIRRARSIVKDLLKFARKENIEKENVCINDVIEQTLSLRKYEHRVNNINVTCDLEEAIPPANGNFVRLQQVLLNILINAEQAIIEEKKGGAIRVRSFFDRKKQLLKVEVSDNGQVIPHEIIGKIFDPFFTTKEVGKGTGLGLSTSYGIIKDHDGDIHVTSNKDWTTFTISLPAMEESVELPVKDLCESKEIVAHGEPILVVDDEPLIVKLLEDFLRRKGFSVITATTGSQALDILQSNKVELVISDIKMPQMDGKKFYSEIKANNPALLEKLIFITGDTLSDDTRKFLKNTKGRFLKKPFSFDEIMKLIDSMSKETVQKELF